MTLDYLQRAGRTGTALAQAECGGSIVQLFDACWRKNSLSRKRGRPSSGLRRFDRSREMARCAAAGDGLRKPLDWGRQKFRDRESRRLDRCQGASGLRHARMLAAIATPRPKIVHGSKGSGFTLLKLSQRFHIAVHRIIGKNLVIARADIDRQDNRK